MSLFAGAGGFDVGLEQAGFSTALAIDNDPDAVQTLRATKAARLQVGNGRQYLEAAHIVEADIAKATNAQLVDIYQAATEAGPPAVLAGGPPCQSFTQPLDPGAGSLLKECVVLAPEARADWIRLACEACDFVGERYRTWIRGEEAEREASA